jgi:hypothetical protein
MEYLAPDLFLSQNDARQMFNMALSSCTPLDNYYLTQFAVSRFPLKEAWFALDFYSYTGGIPEYYIGLDTQLLTGKNSALKAMLPLVLTWDAYFKGEECIALNKDDSLGLSISYHYNSNGSRLGEPLERKLRDKGTPWLNYEFEYSKKSFDTLYNSLVCTLETKRLYYLQKSIENLNHSQVKLNVFVSPMFSVNFDQLLRSKAFPEYLRFLEYCAQHTNYTYFGGSNEYTTDTAYFWDVHHARNTLFKEIYPHFVRPSDTLSQNLWGATVSRDNFEQFKKLLMKYRNNLLSRDSEISD